MDCPNSQRPSSAPVSSAVPAEVVVRRTFDAPRALVFKVWTEAEHLAKWWGPAQFTNPRCEADPRPGGAIHIDMRSPDGTVYPMTGVFDEVTPYDRLIFTTAALDAGGKPMFEIKNTITFVERAGQTELTVHARVLNAGPDAPQYLKGMEAGWAQSLERLAALLRQNL